MPSQQLQCDQITFSSAMACGFQGSLDSEGAESGWTTGRFSHVKPQPSIPVIGFLGLEFMSKNW